LIFAYDTLLGANNNVPEWGSRHEGCA